MFFEATWEVRSVLKRFCDWTRSRWEKRDFSSKFLCIFVEILVYFRVVFIENSWCRPSLTFELTYPPVEIIEDVVLTFTCSPRVLLILSNMLDTYITCPWPLDHILILTKTKFQKSWKCTKYQKLLYSLWEPFENVKWKMNFWILKLCFRQD